MEKVFARWSFEPTLESAQQYRQLLAIKLTEQALSQDIIENFQLAVSELIVNLCRYPLIKAKSASVQLLRTDDYVSLELYDNGASFRNFSQYINSDQPIGAAENGMGLKLIDSLFDDLFYVPGCYRDDGLNVMAFKYYLSGRAKNKSKSILLVDDDQVYQAVLTAYLEKDYRLYQADSVSRGYELLLRAQPDLVICDINMPGGGGGYLFDLLQHVPAVACTAFIYLSGCTDKKLISEALSRPIDAFVEKPVQRQQLLQLIEKTLERQRYLSQQMHRELFQRATLGLQPHLPRKIGAFKCALRHCIPQEGGGDFVLLHQSQLLMADLMGHGLQAKTYVYALAGYLRGLCSVLSQEQLTPCKLLNVLSNGFADDPVLRETLATIAVVNFDNKQLSIASAGHPKPLLISSHAIASVAVQGPLLGLSQAGYREQQVQLEPEQRLLLYSDGFLDAGEELDQQMLNKLKYSAQLPLQQAADFLMQLVYERDLQLDDCTLVLLQLDPND
ncbi:MAG: hypothetical protein OFPI_10170 [Osedax symbiont Rs2]|nr:MAG: hypothetical protein OFPI_10170 [Osedax symbiont Rs2]